MHMLKSLKSFLYDQDYVINLYNNSFYTFNYLELVKLTDELVILKFNGFNIELKGTNFMINKMTNNELLINGKVSMMRYIYE